jgi:hypothetical protein
MYHKIANEIGILAKGIATMILHFRKPNRKPLIRGIIQDIEDVFEEVADDRQHKVWG